MIRIKYFVMALILLMLGCSDNSSDTNVPITPGTIDFSECTIPTESNTLDIVSWNLKNFPFTFQTLDLVKGILESLDADVIALQEIRSINDFEELVNQLQGWEGRVLTFGNSTQRLAYLYKTKEITLIEPVTHLFSENTDEMNEAFTSVRRPLHARFQHRNGLNFRIVNVHLKCCDGSEDRRRKALNKIKQKIDNEWFLDPVVVLGDFNDELVDVDNVFDLFLNDATNFSFTTLPIAQGNSSNWSFPSWPSHLDHILITDELFNKELTTETLRFSACFAGYTTSISDHRPVMIRLESN